MRHVRGKRLRIAALPVVDFDQALVVEEVDSSGAVRGAFRKKLSGSEGEVGIAVPLPLRPRACRRHPQPTDGTFRFSENHGVRRGGS